MLMIYKKKYNRLNCESHILIKLLKFHIKFEYLYVKIYLLTNKITLSDMHTLQIIILTLYCLSSNNIKTCIQNCL